MAPTLNDGDVMLIDRRDAGGSLRDGIYVLRVDERLLVKRLAVHPMGRLVPSSRTIRPTPTGPIAGSTTCIASAG